jgi:hypothetical protein
VREYTIVISPNVGGKFYKLLIKIDFNRNIAFTKYYFTAMV